MSSPKITKEEVAKIAKLSRLQLSDDELQAATKDLGNILDHFAAIGAIDTTDVPTADDVSGLKNVTRSDSADPQALAQHKDLLDAAPESHDGHIKVKSVF